MSYKQDNQDIDRIEETKDVPRKKDARVYFENPVQLSDGYDIDINEPANLEPNKDDIMRRADEPFWRILRTISRILIALFVLALIVFIAVLIVLNPRCQPVPKQIWWQSSIFYRVDLDEIDASCQLDSSNCLPLQKLQTSVNYFKKINANALILSHMNDLSIGFTTIDSKYGSIEDLKALLEIYHKNNIKIIIDFIPNYTNDNHPWFLMSFEEEKYFNKYVWTNKPNNWLNIYSESAWSKSETNQTYYYLHQYEKNHPDLNYYNLEVYQYLMDSVKYWLDIGIDGINLITISRLFEDSLLTDEQPLTNSPALNYDDYNHTYTQHLRETFHLIAELKYLISNYSLAKDESELNEIVLILDSNELVNTNKNIKIKYFGNNEINGLDLIMNNFAASIENHTNFSFNEYIQFDIESTKNRPKVNLWMANDFINSSDRIDNSLLWPLAMFLPGSAIINIDQSDYTNLIQNGTDSIDQNSSIYELNKINSLRNKFKVLPYGQTQLNSNNKNLIAFKRYFDPETSVLVVVNLNPITNNIQNDLISLNSVLKELKLKERTLNVEYVRISDSYSSKFLSNNPDYQDYLNKLTSLTEIKIGKNGLLNDIQIPSQVCFVASWDYVPPDVRDVL